MTADAIRLRLRVLESRGDVRAFFEKAPGSFVVSVDAGPNQSVRTGRDMEALEAHLRRRVAK